MLSALEMLGIWLGVMALAAAVAYLILRAERRGGW